MWQGKKKAVTFSFDDGVTQDIRLVEILNRYGLKSTFNLNSALLGKKGRVDCYGMTVDHNKVDKADVKALYAGHEVAVHTLTHPLLPTLEEAEIIRQVEEDREALEGLCGYPVVGMAYPGGGVNHDGRVADIIGKHTRMRYARTIISTHGFAPQKDLLRFEPSVYYMEECFKETVTKFLEETTEGLLYIWGHSYELDAGRLTWEDFESICATIAGRSDIFYGTNREVLL